MSSFHWWKRQFSILLFSRHEDLISRQGDYYEMWQQQLTKLEEENGEDGEANGSAVVAEVTVEPHGTVN